MSDTQKISLREFVEKHLVINDEHGNPIRLTNAQLAMIDVIDKANKLNCDIERYWSGGRYRWRLVKRTDYSFESPSNLPVL